MKRLAVVLAVCAMGCTSSPATPDASTDAALDEVTQEAAAPCSAPPDQRPEGGTCVLRATGSVTDFADAGLADLVMTFCGPAQCYGTRADDAGAFDIVVGDFIQTENYAMHADGRPDHAVDYLRFEHAAPSIISANMALPSLPPSVVMLPADDAGAPSSVTVGDVTLVIASGTTFNLDIEDFGTATGRVVRVASVPLANAPSHSIIAKLDAVYALAPSGAKSSQKMGVTLANTAGLAPSIAVDILVLGDDYFSIPPNVGVFSVVAAAHVSADGLTIQTDVGEGISELTWLGVRRTGK